MIYLNFALDQSTRKFWEIDEKFAHHLLVTGCGFSRIGDIVTFFV